MTTTLRAAWLNGKKTHPTLRRVAPRKQNSLHKIRSIQDKELKGLKIQPFFYALAAGIGDMELMRADINPDRGPAAQADYARVTAAIRGVEQAFYDAGYSCKGEPYWAEVDGLNDGQIDRIITAAQECLPILQGRGQALQKGVGRGSKERIEFGEFVNRFAEFNQAITGFQDFLGVREHCRHQLCGVSEPPMCALA